MRVGAISGVRTGAHPPAGLRAIDMDTYQHWVTADEPVELAADGVADPDDARAAELSDAGGEDPAGDDPGAAGPGDANPGDVISIVTPVPVPSGWSDPPTDTDGPRLWDRLIISESARTRRYKRPATVVLVEVAGLDKLAAKWGPRVAENTLKVAARVLAKEIRTSDHIARIEPMRFGVLLTETTEIAAINFVERARTACERDVQVASEAVGVAFGWASPPKGGDLSDAMALAAKRLAVELAELTTH
jgi:diguanylate cyclase (GGDEF)-like protein